ncbi:MAG: NADH-quinone oxidoreductase subunit N [Bacteroidetes bacterium]|nr:NADH-quinone oxidoreductase subunit N [Bacteroidota bacterium]
MTSTLPYLSYMPAHLIMGVAILVFFLAKAIPGLKNVSPVGIFVLVLIAGFVTELMMGSESKSLFFNMLQVDSYSRFYNQLFFIIIGVTVLMMKNNDEMNRSIEWEVFGLLSTICLGMMMMTSATHLLMIVVGIELVSLPSYILVALNRRFSTSKEASLKYVLFGSFATGIMLYGISLLFGLTGTLQLKSLWPALAASPNFGTPIYYIAIIMTLAGMSFKIAAVPFHFWCPDAYQAAPTPITAFLSVAPKVAGLALIMRFFADHVPVQSEQLSMIVSLIAMITMTLGNFAALRQKDIKRLLAYSSISHAGFLLMGIAVMNEVGRQYVFFYIVIYALMNMGAFMAIIYLSQGRNFEIKSFAGLIKSKPVMVVGFTICLFSLAGLPPFGGFVGKFYLFWVVIEKGFWALAAVAGVNSVVSLYYYVGVIKTMIIDEREGQMPDFSTQSSVPIGFVILCAIPIVVFGLYWNPLVNLSALVHMF